ncbi:MAG: hypothetical protein MUO76_03365 [Anaerolineaceae bacterium]|nr:hypothetical protein [Anaerolineaceae bacterium]
MNKSLPRKTVVKVLFVYFLLGGGEAIFSLYQLLAISADPKHSLVFGSSAARQAIAARLFARALSVPICFSQP